jgi:molecular chaperone DnaJ
MVTNDKRFERHGYDVNSKSEINFTNAVLGAKIAVETVEGEVSLKIPAGTQSGTTFKIRGKGIQKLRGSGKGDHFVKVNIKTPTSINRKQKKLLEDLDL